MEATPLVAVPLQVESDWATPAQQPVTVGVPFPRGVLHDERILLLREPRGCLVPLQTIPLARWTDGSVKWLLIDFIANAIGPGRQEWSLESGRDDRLGRTRPASPLCVHDSHQGIDVETGAARFMLDRAILAPIVQVEVDGAPILDPTVTQTVLIDQWGRPRRPRIERYEIEASGPVRATVRFDGSFEGRPRSRCRFRARISFFAGLALVRINLTLHNPRRARHRGGLWDLGDPGSIFFRDLSLGLGLGQPGLRRIRWTEDDDCPARSTEAETFEIYQDSSGGENWQSRNHVNRFGKVPCRFRGYRVRQGSNSSFGLRASPIVSVHAESGRVSAAVPEFWQQFPKAIDTTGGTLNLRLFPAQFGDLFELQGGEQKTHTVWLQFSRCDKSEIDPLKWVHRPVCVHTTPAWYAGTGVIPHLSPATADAEDRYNLYLSTVIDGPKSFFARREIIDEYGWRNYGEVYADHEAEHYTGEPPVISHYNNQYDLVFGLLVQYIRSGNRRWFDLGDSLARHVIDIDVYHTDRDKAAYNGGLHWHTNHYRDAATCTHRAYSRHNFRRGDPFAGGGPSSNHNYATGLLHYYYLTGDPNASDVVIGLADWVVNMDDGEQSVFGFLDQTPTGNATYAGEPNYQGPCRGAGNSINVLINGWLLTSRRFYLDKAEGLITRVSHPDDDIPGRNLLNVESRWSYTVFLSSVARYLAAKADAGQLDFMYAYGRTVLVRYAEWMVNHERPYFDQVEKLEFPNETWAGQEFRKANVLRLAAAHAGEPLRSALVRRGDELADRAWHELSRFDSRHSARAVALLLTEWPRDLFLTQGGGTTAPEATRTYSFGAPGTFVPQRERVVARLRTAQGLSRAVIKLADARNWRKIRLRGYFFLGDCWNK
jgi:hypothetical protein